MKRPTDNFYIMYKENAMIGVAQLWTGPRGGRQIRWAAPPRKQIKNGELGEYDVKPIELHTISDELFPGTFLIRPEDK